MDLYADNILEHFRNPRNRHIGLVPGPGTHTETNASCGDEITVALTIKDNAIAAVAWNGSGCAISTAAMSMLSEKLKGMTPADARNSPDAFVQSLLGIPISRRRERCALLGLSAVRGALRK